MCAPKSAISVSPFSPLTNLDGRCSPSSAANGKAGRISYTQYECERATRDEPTRQTQRRLLSQTTSSLSSWWTAHATVLRRRVDSADGYRRE